MEKDKLQDIKNRFEIVGNSPLLNRALEIATKVAPTDMNALIIGESGVGKENVSKIIHHLSKRKHNHFIAINCGAIPEGTIDSELFGHEKGSFTSAHDARKGYFETVDGGTIFLDEIGELPLETQSRLLRVLENGEFLKVGSSKVQKTDVRIIAATNKDLLDLSQKGKFREDLYYRLSTVTIKIPPLRERKEDIPYLWAKFSSDFSDKYRIPPLELNADAMARVQNFYWPGNIRQLKNIIEQISILETDRFLDGDAISKYLPQQPGNFLTFNGNTSQTENKEGFGEREMMFMLFDLKRDIADLRKMLYDFISAYTMGMPVNNASAPIVPARMLESGYLGGQSRHEEYHHAQPVQPIQHFPADDNDDFSDEYAPHEPVNENLSLSGKEKEMIVRALERHHGKRKLAAADLGISERTLYRKIKEYNLEE